MAQAPSGRAGMSQTLVMHAAGGGPSDPCRVKRAPPNIQATLYMLMLCGGPGHLNQDGIYTCKAWAVLHRLTRHAVDDASGAAAAAQPRDMWALHTPHRAVCAART